MSSSPDRPLKVLLVEDDEEDYLITSDMLFGQDRARFELEWCSSFEAGLEAIRARSHDAYLIDYRLGPRTGLELVREAFAQGAHVPVIMLTGETDYEIDLEASALGVTDFLVKHQIDPPALERSIRYAVSHHRAMSELALSEERYALAVRAANDGIWDWDLSDGAMYLSPRWHAILGMPEGAKPEPPERWFELVHPDDLLRLRAAIDAHVGGETPFFSSEHRIRHADGGWRWVLSRGLAIRGEDGAATRMAGSMSDITDRHNAETQLQHDALHDGLTGLPNRALMIDRLEQSLRRATREAGSGCAVLFMDIDNFKLVNDSLSHGVGDHLLIALAGRLTSMLRPGDTVARIGGDEFTLLLDGVRCADDAQVVTDRLLASLTRPFSIDGHELFVTASIGIALSSPRVTPTDLLRNADIAMYDAKRRGRARSAVFDESMHRRVVDRLARENELREAVEARTLPIHYQPIVDLATGRVRGFEALVRWPGGSQQVEPRDFIPIAEEAGMIASLGLHVLRTALDALAHWRLEGLVSEEVFMSVNVSGRQLEEPGLPAQVRAAIASAGLPPTALRLEITESTLMHEREEVQRVAAEVCSGGVALHLDDFGTGYSSLAALHRLPVDTLKIDRSLIASLGREGGESDVIVRSTIALSHSLGLHVTAEGIEDVSQLTHLRRLGCEYGQGFLFSPPVPADQVRELLSGFADRGFALVDEQAHTGA